MKIISFFLLSILIGFSSCKSTRPASEAKAAISQPEEQPVQTVNFSDASTWIIGYFNINRLYQKPHSDWFIKGLDDYKSDSETVSQLKGLNTEGLSIKIVLGTWCPDSRREVPRFMRLLNDIGFPSARVQLIGVDNVKFSPIDNYDGLKIERVPTFIFYRNNIETGRIIENPKASLEQDMLSILTRNEKR